MYSYFSQPTRSRVSILARTSFSIDSWYLAIFSRYEGTKLPSMRTAKRAALVLLLMATVATGTPRCCHFKGEEEEEKGIGRSVSFFQEGRFKS